MAPEPGIVLPRVEVGVDRLEAHLLVPDGCNLELLTTTTVQMALQEASVEITAPVMAAAQAALQQLHAGGSERRFLLAQAKLPTRGDDASIQWSVHSPARQADPSASFYDRCVYVMVQKDQVLGRYVAPTTGADGRDVLGRTIPAVAGRDIQQRLDDTIMIAADGTLVAQAQGVLVRTRDEARISEVLQINEEVDFSTGNISFHGDIVIRGRVCDLFVVQATGNVEIGGAVEAATVQCGGDLVARAGVAGRGRGSVQIGGSIVARYLDQVEGEVHRDLCFEREMINCKLTVGRDIRSPHGAMIGGEVVVCGDVELGTLGSHAAVPTRLVLGRVPLIEQQIAQLLAMIEQLKKRRDLLQEKLRLLKLAGERACAADRERQTELMCMLPGVDTHIARGEAALETLRQRQREARQFNVKILRCLMPEACIQVGERVYCVSHEMRGQFTIRGQRDGQVTIQQGNGAPRPLEQVVSHMFAAA